MVYNVSRWAQFPSYFSKDHFNIIISSKPRPSKRPRSLMFPNQTAMHFSHLLWRMAYPSHSPWFFQNFSLSTLYINTLYLYICIPCCAYITSTFADRWLHVPEQRHHHQIELYMLNKLCHALIIQVCSIAGTHY